MRRSALALGVVCSAAAPAPARAEEPPERPLLAIHDVGGPGTGRTFSERIAEQLTLLGDSVGGHVGVLTLDAVRFRIDGPRRRAHLRLAGETRYLALRIEGDIHFRRGAAEVDAKVDLMIAGHAVRFELPDFEVMPRSYLGERYVEVRVPLVRGSF